jgi:phosphinothricin acetyltransferase
VDVSVYLVADERGRGTGRALYDVLLPLLRDLGYVAAHAAIALPNPASVRLHEGHGFSPVGVYRSVGYKHGAWHDVGWWQLPLVAPPPLSPEEPRAYEP